MIVFSRGEESDIQEVDGRLVDVFVNEQIRKCVVFLYEDVVIDDEGTVERQEVGTGFVIAKSLDNSDLDIQSHMVYPDRYFLYVVTARHVIADAEGDIFIRLNRDMARVMLLQEEVEGKVLDIPTHKDDWQSHPKVGTTDVAVCRLKLPVGNFLLRAMPFATLLTKIYTAREGIRTGNEVFSVGLFKGHPGMDKRVEPVIRFGHISLMLPFEKIKVYLSYADKQAEKSTPVEAYLIESRSWGGQSGSPVLIYHPPLEQTGAPELMGRFHFPFILGLIHGQYEYDIQSGGSMVSAGMCIVIPSDKIREAIMQKRLAAERQEQLEKPRSRPKNAPRPVPTSARHEAEFTEDDMMSALEKASRKIEPNKEKSEK